MIRLSKYNLATIFMNWIFAMTSAAEQPTTANTRSAGTFHVVVDKDYLSLQANAASLARIFEEIGKQSKIDFIINIDPEEKITTRLDRVPIEDGIKQLAKNVTVFYAEDSKDKTQRITRVVVLPEGKGTAGRAKAAPQPVKGSEPSSKSEAFKFEFDPAKSIETKGSRKQP